ncbi:hypothetical protein CMUS01_13204 [Colletotrichum musicola]|uniref:Uncharacterized protein n=1 Tax=Colletotrichum musicola TaxID=2175873 RepID=A0A8H6JEM9_9PEZI|nr:hypothetical protein CMUS01_13204 [Colletotrichum musicola]
MSLAAVLSASSATASVRVSVSPAAYRQLQEASGMASKLSGIVLRLMRRTGTASQHHSTARLSNPVAVDTYPEVVKGGVVVCLKSAATAEADGTLDHVGGWLGIVSASQLGYDAGYQLH